MTTKRKGHPHSRPLPGPGNESTFITAASNIATCAILDAILYGATPQAALLAAARELIRQAQVLQREAVDAGGCAPPIITGGPRFTRTA